MKPRLIVIDGVDGCGKGTQIKLLKKALSKEKVFFSREPGGPPFSEKIRELILEPRNEDVPPETDFFLFWASRMMHVKTWIEPMLKDGTGFITDRFDSSTLAFQIYGEENNQLEDFFFHVRDLFLEDLPFQPTYIFLDLHPEISLERMAKDSNRESTHFDLKPLEYHMRVQDGFNQFAARVPHCNFVDANQEIEEVFAEILAMVKREFEI